ncbi:polysaccharide biosynthesis tyrosine autokinase [Marinobacter halodurans]|uniref:Polysaccharide biosynthesis tyrosine autokinase n=2 Tax=Marinobacter halodurans TaxID=2528979 RepID=A0ABY1ZQE7_9GAMM|nr:polysaccharide biosynthesis tyrosine autokinase [Marinobacter halodurans]
MTMQNSDNFTSERPGAAGQAQAAPMPVLHQDTLGDENIRLGDYFAILMERKGLILLVTLLATLVGIGYAVTAPPVYQTDALLQIEQQKPIGLRQLGSDPSSLMSQEPPIVADVEILKSRMVLGTAVKNLGLEYSAWPDYMPVVGSAYARYFEKHNKGLADPMFGMGEYAWGGESITLDNLEVPDSLVGTPLTVVAGQNGQYKVMDPDGKLLMNGEVGRVSETRYGDQQSLKVSISELVARPGTHFTMERVTPLDAIKHVEGNFSVYERSKNSGILGLSLTGTDPQQASEILNEISQVYVKQNIARNSAEAQQSLEFLEHQLPELKKKLTAAEEAYNDYRIEYGSVNLDEETKVMLDRAVKVDQELLELEQKRSEMRQRFKPEHPSMIAIDQKIARLRDKQSDLNQKSETLPKAQQKLLRLSQDVEVNKSLYTKLLSVAQELRVAKAGTVGNVRIIDNAVPMHSAVAPNRKLIVLLACVTGAFLGVVLVLILRALRGGVEDPDEIERNLGLPVYATVIHSDRQAKMNRKTSRHARVLADVAPDDKAVESLRSLRTTLHFSLLGAKNNLIMMTGPSPQIGKSFVTMNLGAVLAQSGKRILLIDADIRKGRLHQMLGLRRDKGVTEMITRDGQPMDYVRKTTIPGLHLLSGGQLPPNPAELLLHESFGRKVLELAEHFDYVLLDAPPILAVTDAAIIGRLAGTSLMVVKDRNHPMRELEQSAKQLQQAGVSISGIVFNDVQLHRQNQQRGNYVYQYKY